MELQTFDAVRECLTLRSRHRAVGPREALCWFHRVQGSEEIVAFKGIFRDSPVKAFVPGWGILGHVYATVLNPDV